MSQMTNIQTVKCIADIETPTISRNYLVNGAIYAPLTNDKVLAWIADGNIPEPAYTQEELDNYQEEFTFQELVAQINKITVDYDGHTFSGSSEAQSFIVAMLTKIEGESPQATRNIYTIDGKTRAPMTKTNLLELISIIDLAQEAITNV